MIHVPQTSTFPITIRSFGPLTILHGSESVGLAPRSRAHALLAYLLLHHGRTLERAYLASQFDPELPDATARRRLSDTLYTLRRFIPEDRLYTTSTSIALVLHPDDHCDLLELETLLHIPIDAAPIEAILATPEPLFCPELDHEWVIQARESLGLRLINYLERLADHVYNQANYSSARALLDRVLQLDPARETAQLSLLRVFEQLGRASEATQQYQQWKRRLHEEFGWSPEPETERCYQRLMRLLSEREGRPHVVIPEQLPLVGRDYERRMILGLMEGVTPHPHVILLEGMPGIGKSHLLHYIAADATWRDWMVGLGRANRNIDVLEAVLQPLLTPVNVAKLRDVIAPQWWSQLTLMFPMLDPEAPISNTPPFSDTVRRQQYNEALLQLIEALTSWSPLLLIFDDMHLASASELESLLLIAGLTTSQRLMVIVSYRSSVRDDSETWALLRRLDVLAAGQRLELKPLSSEQCATLLLQVLGPCSSTMIEQLCLFTNGHPLFLCETLDFLLEHGALQRAVDGSWNIDSTVLESVQLADASRAIATRIAELDPDAWEILALMALHDGNLSLPQLATLSGWTYSHVAEVTQQLLQRHLLITAGSGYTCRHALIVQAVREQLAPDVRSSFHQRLWKLLTEQTPESIIQRATHAFYGELWAEAVPLLLQASNLTRVRADYRKALRFLEQAWLAVDQGQMPEKGSYRIAILLERLLIWKQHTPKHEQRITDLQLLDSLLPTDHPARYDWQIAYLDYLLDRGDNQLALDLIEQLHAGLRQNLPHYELRLMMLGGKAAQRTGTIEQGIDFFQHAMGLAELVGDIETQAGAMGNLAIYDHFRGRFSSARQVYSQVAELCEQHGLIMAGFTATCNLAAVAQAEGDLVHALKGYEKAITGYERYGITDPSDLENLAEVCILLGMYERAEAVLMQADMLWQERDGSPALTRCRQATLVIARGQLDQGWSLLEEVARLNQTSSDMRVEGEIHLWKAFIAMEQGRFAEAIPFLEHVTNLYQRLGVQFYAALIDAMQAVIAARQGQSETAQISINQASQELSLSFGTFIDPHYLLGVAAETIGNFEQAQHHYQQAWKHLQLHAYWLSKAQAKALWEAPLNQRIVWAVRRFEHDQSLIMLPLKTAPTGRARQPWEEVRVFWDVPDSPQTLDPTARQQALQQLVQQAQAQEANPTVTALATALQVSTATISRDLAELRKQTQSIHVEA